MTKRNTPKKLPDWRARVSPATAAAFDAAISSLIDTIISGTKTGVAANDAFTAFYDFAIADLLKEMGPAEVAEAIAWYSSEIDRQLKARMLAGPAAGSA